MFESEGVEEGEEEVCSDDYEVEDDEFFEMIVVVKARPAFYQPRVALLLDPIIVDQQQSSVSLNLLHHNLYYKIPLFIRFIWL